MFEVVKAARTEELEDTRDLFVDDESFMVAIEGIKDGRPHSLLTREHFAEMIKFQHWFEYELVVPVPRPNSTWTSTTYYDLCKKSIGKSNQELKL